MKDTSKYESLLKAELGTLIEELQSVGIHNPDNPSDWVAVPSDMDLHEADPNVEADRAEEWNERRALVATLETRYNNLTRALKKIVDGSYGTCEICGNEIEEDRLDANPAARTDKVHMNDEGTLPT